MSGQYDRDLHRFMKKVKKDASGCWLWQAGRYPTGYGQFGQGGWTNYAHRWLWIRLRGPIPDGLQLDHLCRVRECVNPAHLEAVTPLENQRRGYGNGRKTHCPQGHGYTPKNTLLCAGRRSCRTCNRIRAGERYHRLHPSSAPRRPAPHCAKGHEYTPENTYHDPKYPTVRHCRRCRADWVKAKRRAIRLAARRPAPRGEEE